MTRTVDCPEHGEQPAVMVDPILVRYGCQQCWVNEQLEELGEEFNEKDRG